MVQEGDKYCCSKQQRVKGGVNNNQQLLNGRTHVHKLHPPASLSQDTALGYVCVSFLWCTLLQRDREAMFQTILKSIRIMEYPLSIWGQKLYFLLFTWQQAQAPGIVVIPRKDAPGIFVRLY